MAKRPAMGEAECMISNHPTARVMTTSADQLAGAATSLRRSVRGPDALRTLPLTLALVERALDELATGMVVAAQVVAESPDQPNTSLDLDHLGPEARALCWHLHELAARLRAARAAGTTAREWARALASEGAEAQALAGLRSSWPRPHAPSAPDGGGIGPGVHVYADSSRRPVAAG